MFQYEGLQNLNSSLGERVKTLSLLTQAYVDAIDAFKKTRIEMSVNRPEIYKLECKKIEAFNMVSPGLSGFLNRCIDDMMIKGLDKESREAHVKFFTMCYEKGDHIRNTILSKGLFKTLSGVFTSSNSNCAANDKKVINCISEGTGSYVNYEYVQLLKGLRDGEITEKTFLSYTLGKPDVCDGVLDLLDGASPDTLAEFTVAVSEYFSIFNVLPRYELDFTLLLASVVAQNKSMTPCSFFNTVNEDESINRLIKCIEEKCVEYYSADNFLDNFRNDGNTIENVTKLLSHASLVDGAYRFEYVVSTLVDELSSVTSVEKENENKEKEMETMIDTRGITIEGVSRGISDKLKLHGNEAGCFFGKAKDEEEVSPELKEAREELAKMKRKVELLERERNYQEMIRKVKDKEDAITKTLENSISETRKELDEFFHETEQPVERKEEKGFLDRAWENGLVRGAVYTAAGVAAVYAGKKLYDYFTEDSNDVIIIDGEY